VHGQRSLIIIIAALLMGGLAVFFANSYFNGVEQRSEKIEHQLILKNVVVARAPIAMGGALTADKLRVSGWPADAVPQGSFSDPAGVVSRVDRPHIALRQIAAGEPILQSMMTGSGHGVISATLPQDKRAVAIRVNDVTGVAGFALPGDAVDVLLTRQLGAGNGPGEQITDTIVENIRVIAVDQNANQASKDPVVGRTMTLEVDSGQAQKLALAGQIGTLSLALRNSIARDPGTISTTHASDLAKGEAIRSAQAVATERGTASVQRRVIAVAATPVAQGASVIVGKGTKISSVKVPR
jgi:pilus assembly protein CpaB